MIPRRPSRLRNQRHNDFRSRAHCAPENVYRHMRHGWEYIPVHPFGDETEILAKLEMNPEDCANSDAWWCIDADMALVGCQARPGCGAGKYFAVRGHHGTHLTLIAVIDTPFVTRAHMEETMAFFHGLGFPNARLFALRRGTQIELSADGN